MATKSFYFSVSGQIAEWSEVPTQDFDYQRYLKEIFDFDTNLLTDMEQCKWEKDELTLTFDVD